MRPYRYVLAVDPGNIESAYVLVDASTFRPVAFAKKPNVDVRDYLRDVLTGRAMDGPDPADVLVVIENIGHYGKNMSAGASVFDTCRMIGRLEEICITYGVTPALVKRVPIKVALTKSARATDKDVRDALVARFTPGAAGHGKGDKDAPGWFYGFASDVWQAYAVAVFAIDMGVNPGDAVNRLRTLQDGRRITASWPELLASRPKTV